MVDNKIKNVGGSSRTRPPSPPLHRRQPTRITTTPRLILLLIAFACCFSLTSASHPFQIEEELVEVEAQSLVLGSTFESLAQSGTILTDPNPAPEPRNWAPHPAAGADLRRRAGTEAAASDGSSSTEAPTSTASGMAAAETPSTGTLPTPFDMGFSGNISTGCNSFMTSMLANSTFNECLPFSLLLQNSNSFFQVTKSLVRITQTLDFACAANVTQCAALMSSFAANLTTTSACASDVSAQNPLIQHALTGLKAYKPLYTASCLRDPGTSSYCFADAITNASSPSDSHIYFLPLNTSLVSGSQPTCDTCLQDTMAVFEASSADRRQALAKTYVPAASQINMNCGPGFVNASLAPPLYSAAAASVAPTASVTAMALSAALATWLLT
ncbi:c6 zinc finger domain containing protein [Diplocarpon rosae]|nr:c6 zinc finger domain containing protein [Diplocarpon rosae]